MPTANFTLGLASAFSFGGKDGMKYRNSQHSSLDGKKKSIERIKKKRKGIERAHRKAV